MDLLFEIYLHILCITHAHIYKIFFFVHINRQWIKLVHTNVLIGQNSVLVTCCCKSAGRLLNITLQMIVFTGCLGKAAKVRIEKVQRAKMSSARSA